MAYGAYEGQQGKEQQAAGLAQQQAGYRIQQAGCSTAGCYI